MLSLCSRTESLHLAGLPVSWFSVNPTRSSSANTRPSQQADGRQAEEVEQPRRRRRGRRARGRRRRSSCRAYGVGLRSTSTRFPAQPVPAQGEGHPAVRRPPGKRRGGVSDQPGRRRLAGTRAVDPQRPPGPARARGAPDFRRHRRGRPPRGSPVRRQRLPRSDRHQLREPQHRRDLHRRRRGRRFEQPAGRIPRDSAGKVSGPSRGSPRDAHRGSGELRPRLRGRRRRHRRHRRGRRPVLRQDWPPPRPTRSA